MDERNQITEGVIWKQLLIFFFPIMIGTFFQQIYNTADSIVVGRFVGKEALAAVGGSVNQIVNLVGLCRTDFRCVCDRSTVLWCERQEKS